MSKKENLIGRCFGRWTVLEEGTPVSNATIWKCKCACGVIREVRAGHLKSGASVSCGCYSVDVSKKLFFVHGHTLNHKHSPTHNSWRAMKSRCNNEKDSDFNNYGGRGITVCPEWDGEHGFENFLKDMGNRPEGLSLERIDMNNGYCKENCKWATPLEQANNTRRNHLITFKGETKTIAEWQRFLGFGRVIGRRLGLGWSIEKSLTTPVK
jgi:hypothetical protein